MSDMTCHFVFEKETKGAVRYYEADEGEGQKPPGTFLIGTIYLRKNQLPGPPPKKFTITITTMG